MRRRSSSTNSRRSNRNIRTVVPRLFALLSMIVGFIVSLPFIINVIILGKNYHHIHLAQGLMILGVMIGGPMFLIGLIGIFSSKKSAVSSTLESDMARTRFVAETTMFKDKR